MTDQELENLVRLTGLVDQIEADLAILLGMFLELADMARGDDGGDTMLRWRERGHQAMDAEAGVPPQPKRSRTAWQGAVTGPPNIQWPDPEPELVRVVVAAISSADTTAPPASVVVVQRS